MKDKNKSVTKKNARIKTIIPILIVCVLVLLWFFKHSANANSSSEMDNTDFGLNATKTLDLEQLKSYGLPIILEFGSESCIPCQQMAPIIKALNEELEGKAIIKFVDVGNDPELAAGFPISLIPTQVFIDTNGNPYDPADPDTLSMKLYVSKETGEHVFTTHEGTLTKDELLEILEEMGMT